MLIEVAHSPPLILASLIVAIMGAFTALRLTSNLRNNSIAVRKKRVSQGAFALGTSIWSMHFIAMLAIKLPVSISYDPLRTLASALIAVLVVGLAFLSLHFGERTQKTIIIAGVLTGFGTAGMHYLGMSAISANVDVVFSAFGIVLSICIGIAASIAALALAYGDRSLIKIAGGAVVLGLAISAMHHTAMHFTTFYKSDETLELVKSVLDNETLALIVVVSSFILCGLFLLLAIPAGSDTDNLPRVKDLEPSIKDENFDEQSFSQTPAESPETGTIKIKAMKIPYEQNNVVMYLSPKNIHAVKADGHYTCIYNGVDNLFCPWSISRMEEVLEPDEFIRTHRSFLVNKKSIVGIKRSGDKTFCIVGTENGFEIPIARPQINELKKLLQTG